MEDFKTSDLKITWTDKKGNRENVRGAVENIELQSISHKFNQMRPKKKNLTRVKCMVGMGL